MPILQEEVEEAQSSRPSEPQRSYYRPEDLVEQAVAKWTQSLIIPPAKIGNLRLYRTIIFISYPTKVMLK